MLTEAERERTAYHEAGHALVGMLTPGADPVRKVSIIPRGQALGVTFQRPTTDRYGYDASATCAAGSSVALGGRAAEEVVYGNVTTGAESDLEQVTAASPAQMVGRWGHVASDRADRGAARPTDEGRCFPGTSAAVARRRSELVDDEVRRIVDECYERAVAAAARATATGSRRWPTALLERETLDELDAYRGRRLRPPAGGGVE